jgi:hypothetical protein
MQNEVEAFFSDLQRDHLKAMGFKKVRHTFSRARPGFTERIQFQGSSWNDPERPWTFYLNYGIQFHGVPPRTSDRDLPGTHCLTRIGWLVPGAPKDFALSGDRDELKRRLASLVDQASARVAGQLQELRERYVATPTPRLSLA